MNPVIDSQTQGRILSHFVALPFWHDHWDRAAVVITGSVASSRCDQFSDLDIFALVPKDCYAELYEHYKAAIEKGSISVLNRRALEFNEFPYTLIAGIDGHYQLQALEDVQASIEEYDDVTKWVHMNNLVLHDPTGVYLSLQKQAGYYAEEVLAQKLRYHRLQSLNDMWSLKSQLKRPSDLCNFVGGQWSLTFFQVLLSLGRFTLSLWKVALSSCNADSIGKKGKT